MISTQTDCKPITGIHVDNNETKIIEIIGPPGVGKSTLYKAVCKTWRVQANWIYPDRLLSSTQSASTFIFCPEHQLRKLPSKDPKTISVEFGHRFIENNKELAHFVWNQLSNALIYGEGDISKRFRSSYFLFRDFCRYQAIREANYDKPCIIDEGLLDQSFFVIDDHELMISLMDQYLPLLPLPHAVVYVNTGHKHVIVDRLLSRKKTTTSHLSKDRIALEKTIELWQFLFDLIIKRMKEYKVPVYYIDGLKPMAEKILLLQEILR